MIVARSQTTSPVCVSLKFKFKSRVEAILNNKNKSQPGKAAAPANTGAKSNQNDVRGIDQKEKKIYEIYASSGKVMAPIGSNNFAQGNQPSNQNGFLQNKYQFATYYGQKPSYPSPATNSQQQNQVAMVGGGGQYEYNISGE